MGETIMQMYEMMNETAQKELYDFALFLLNRSETQTKQEQKVKIATINRRPGIAKDPDFYMAPDFDEPLEDFAEYM